jgi:hypothetical protein
VNSIGFSLAHADLKVSATTPGTGPAKPFTQEQVVSMVRDGFGDESGAKLIEQRGIDFAPAEDFLQILKAAGASEAFLNALRGVEPPQSKALRAFSCGVASRKLMGICGESSNSPHLE